MNNSILWYNPDVNPYIEDTMNEFERRACMYLWYFEQAVRAGDITMQSKLLDSYVFWRNANEMGKEWANATR